MKNKIRLGINIFEILLIIAICAWDYMKDERMGMVRHITFWNSLKFPKIYTSTVINMVVAGIVVIALLHLLIMYITKNYNVIGLMNVIFSVLSVFYILMFNVDKSFIYYYYVTFLIIINVLQVIKSILAISK